MNNTDTIIDYTAVPFWQWDSLTTPEPVADAGIPFDTLHPLFEHPDTIFRESLFEGHSLAVSSTGVHERLDTSTPAWVFVDIILITALLGLYTTRLRKIRFKDLMQSLFDLRAMDRLMRDCNLNSNALMFPMGLMLVAALMLPVHQMLLEPTGILGYVAIVAGAGLLYAVRNWLLRLLGNSFDNRQGVALFITNNYLFHLAETMGVIILLLPYFYLPGAKTAMAYVLVFYLGVAFMIRFFRGTKVFLTHRNSTSFYLFYYLCIVESIPILAIVKWFFIQ